jgi:GDP-4-dehydro-6-deoxy-D-mannose reductase
MSKRALVTGANGFVGRYLRERLTARGWDLRCGIYGEPVTSDEEFHCDIAAASEVRQMVEWAGPVSHVFHLAALTFVPISIEKPETTMTANLVGTIHLIEAMRGLCPEARLVYIGSAGAYGQPTALPVTEDHPFRPLNPYDISKAAADQYCEFASQAGWIEILRMRPFNHSGAGQSNLFVLPAFALQIARIEAGELPPVIKVGNLDTARDFLHVRDVVGAYEFAADKGVAGEAYNVCSGTSTRIGDALDILLKLARVPITVEVDPELLRPTDAPNVVGSNAKLAEHTGWQPELPFETILSDLLDEARTQIP